MTLPVTPIDCNALARYAELVEAEGFDYVGCGEHLMFRGPVANAFVRLAYVAARTERIGLVSAVVPLPLYPAALAAKLAMELQFVSSGRFHLGVGVAGEYPAEFALAGVPIDERGARTDEALDVIRGLSTGMPFSCGGRFSTFDNAVLAPAPSGVPLPIWVAGRSSRAMRRATRLGATWFPYLVTAEQLSRSVGELLTCSASLHGALERSRVCAGVFVNVSASSATARYEAETVVSGLYDLDFSGRLGRYLLVGTPEECADRIAALLAAGANDLMFVAACGAQRWEEVVALLGQEVLPRVVSGIGPANARPRGSAQFRERAEASQPFEP